MNRNTKILLLQSLLVFVVIIIVYGLLILPKNPPIQNYVLAILSILTGARFFMKWR